MLKREGLCRLSYEERENAKVVKSSDKTINRMIVIGRWFEKCRERGHKIKKS